MQAMILIPAKADVIDHLVKTGVVAGKSKRRGRPKGRHSRNKSGLGKSM